MKYKILSAASVAGLCSQVRDHLRNGWELQGGVSVASAEQTFHQAMIQEESSCIKFDKSNKGPNNAA